MNPAEFFQLQNSVGFRERIQRVSQIVGAMAEQSDRIFMRAMDSAADREVEIADPETGARTRLLMFGANNYLGLANHPLVRERAAEAARRYGASFTGSPVLNGYSSIYRQLEERMAAFKGYEDAMLFSSGFSANVGWVNAVVRRQDTVLYDEYSHTSFTEGLAARKNVRAFRFLHNNAEDLQSLLDQYAGRGDGDAFVFVEGLYSMDGDVAPIDEIAPRVRAAGAALIIDDAHGTGALGATGRGVLEHFGMMGAADINMGTMSKGLGATGGFVCASRDLIRYLRAFSKSYVFSASLAPAVIASILAAFDVLEQEPDRVARLQRNVAYAAERLRPYGLHTDTPTAVLPLRVPAEMDVNHAARRMQELGIFVNPIAYPAVPINKERFRISLMADHTQEDLDRLVAAIEQVWSEFRSELEGAA